jgi:hypothetical protein
MGLLDPSQYWSVTEPRPESSLSLVSVGLTSNVGSGAPANLPYQTDARHFGPP